MREISLQELDSIRKTGFRPGVVCCFMNQRRMLLVYKKDYSLWLIPQGGINNEETVEDAIKREVSEELGDTFLDMCEKTYEYIGEGDLEFSPTSRGIKELYTDGGQRVRMKGKKYFFFAINAKSSDWDVSKSVFDEYTWANYTQAEFLLGLNYQLNKRQLTQNALKQLKLVGLID